MAKGFRNAKHIAQWRSTLGDAYCKSLRSIAIASVSTEDVLAVLRPIWSATPETAQRLRGRIERVLARARVQGLRSGENPARWREHLEHMLSRKLTLTRGHHPALPWEQLSGFMRRLRERPSMSAYALEWTILTAARTSETIGAVRAEIDIGRALWTVPAVRMKERREHRVPLTPRALELIKITSELDSDWLFPGDRGPLSNMAMLELLKDLAPGYTVHGFRSTFRDWAGDEANFPDWLAEAALSHLSGDKAERAYRRGDALKKRRDLMLAWADFAG